MSTPGISKDGITLGDETQEVYTFNEERLCEDMRKHPSVDQRILPKRPSCQHLGHQGLDPRPQKKRISVSNVASFVTWKSSAPVVLVMTIGGFNRESQVTSFLIASFALC